MVTAAAPISLADYLQTDHEPDCEYIDGVLEDRNTGMLRHSRAQAVVAAWLSNRSRRVLIAQRVQTAPSRIRVPDICVAADDSDEEIVLHPPALWIEILSPDEDGWTRFQLKLDDVLTFGVPTIWIIDPYSSEAWTTSQDGLVTKIEDGILRCSNLNLEMPLSEVLPAE